MMTAGDLVWGCVVADVLALVIIVGLIVLADGWRAQVLRQAWFWQSMAIGFALAALIATVVFALAGGFR